MPCPSAFSRGSARPRAVLPPQACDCHVHVYDGRYPATPGARLLPPDASAGDYRALQRRLGTSRCVLVTPSTYGSDNRCMLDGLAAAKAQLGQLAFASGGSGTILQMQGELLQRKGGVRFIHAPNKGDRPALAVTSAARLKALPDVLTMAEAGMVGGTPPAIGRAAEIRLCQVGPTHPRGRHQGRLNRLHLPVFLPLIS